MDKNDVIGRVNEQRLRTELLLKVNNALDEFVVENHDDIQQIKGNNLIWDKVLTVLEKVWWTIDTTMEAIDSIPDILQGHVQRL